MPDTTLISASDYVEFMKLRRERLNFLTQRYDDMVARMQTPEAAAGMDALFNASSEELGSAAIAAGETWLSFHHHRSRRHQRRGQKHIGGTTRRGTDYLSTTVTSKDEC
jgi:hypothetical protein